MNFNTLFSLICQAKITGTGRLGRGKIYVKLMQTITDCNYPEETAETNFVKAFGYKMPTSDTYASFDKMLNRYIKTGQGYFYEYLKFNDFEKNLDRDYKIYLVKMNKACSEIFDTEKIYPLVYTLLEIIHQDSEISTILYGNKNIPKEKFFGSFSRPKNICIEAFLIGLIYHTHKNISGLKASTETLKFPDKFPFRAVRYKDENSLDLDRPFSLIYDICKNAKCQESAEMKYQTEIKHNDIIVEELPENENIFLYGAGGAGKSTFLLNQLKNKNTVNFYFPLYNYRYETHNKLRDSGCWILLNILLKYHCQYEYQTYESMTANEGEDITLQQLSELENELKLNISDRFPKYTLMLDGLNEISAEMQAEFLKELYFICSEWKNVRIIISGRTVPDYNFFKSFYRAEICGITDSELNSALSDFPECSETLKEILKKPLFLNIYLQNQNTEKQINTRGELLDSYVMNWKIKPSDCFAFGIEKSVIQFIVQYVLPFTARAMTDSYNFFDFSDSRGICFEIERGDLFRAVEKAYEFYLINEEVYQSYTAPKGFRKKILFESRKKNDFIELITENIGLMKISESNPQKICFTHQYFRDYFNAKHILNLLETMEILCKNTCVDEKKEIFRQFNINKTWFFPDCEYETYRLIGEICGDYKNTADENNAFWGDENFWYQRTILDRILDIYRESDLETDEFHITENIINTMGAVRRGIICGVNFDRLPLPFNIPCNIKFSFNGLCPSTFRYCKIFRLSVFSAGEINNCSSNQQFNDIWAEYSVYSPDKNFILIIIENNYVILWNVHQEKIIWDYDFSKYAENSNGFDYAEFSPEGKYIMLRKYNGFDMKTYELKIETFTGKVISFNSENINACYKNRDFIDEELKCRILSQFTHFRNCIFTNAEFKDYDYRSYLDITGAVF
ncbi:MAG: hypothetical protein PUH54_09140 [Oscillospiraceae bacterium]|nr:hypothetical protein [Oscillospiraceae bacterium]